MATLLNTLLASIFPVLFTADTQAAQTRMPEPAVEIIVTKEDNLKKGFRVYLYPEGDFSFHS